MDPTPDKETAQEQRERLRAREEEERERGRERDERAREAADRRRRRRSQRKERVLHTRISEPLAEDIRRIAEELRVPVSNIVRNVLEEAFSVVETVTESVGDMIEDVVDEAERTGGWSRHFRDRRRKTPRRPVRPDPGAAVDEPVRAVEEPSAFPDVVGWQPLILNRPQACAGCGEALERNDRAFAGMGESGVSSTYLCQDCMEDRR